MTNIDILQYEKKFGQMLMVTLDLLMTVSFYNTSTQICSFEQMVNPFTSKIRLITLHQMILKYLKI